MNNSRDDYEVLRNRYREVIRQQGHALCGVFASQGQLEKDPNFIPFIYSMGLTNHLLPELLIGAQRLTFEDLGGIINSIAEQFMKNHSTVMEEQWFELDNGDRYHYRTVPISPTAATEQYLIQAEPVLRKPINSVNWVQISDRNHRWPGEPGFENTFGQFTDLTRIH